MPALRTLAKSPGFAFTAVATLALGIGACTAMFSIVNAVLLKPLPVREPERLVWIENSGTNGLSARTSRTDNFVEWQRQSQSFEALGCYFAFFDYGRTTLTGSGDPERLRNVGISGNLLDVLGVKPFLGRNFTAEESVWNGPKAILLSHTFWQKRFAGDHTIVGRTLSLNNQPTTVVGVLPPTFDFDALFAPGTEIELISPFPLSPETARWGNTLFGIGRLKPGITVEQAQAELDVINERLRAENPNRGGFGARVTTLDDSLRGRFRKTFYVLAGAVACVLAIACVNLSNLLLARLNARRHEFAVRIALGARPRHLVAQTLTESLLLAAGGALVGIPLAVAATAVLAGLQTFGVPLLQDAQVDPVALAVTIGLTGLAGVCCGLLPALHLARDTQRAAQQTSTHQRTAGRDSAFIRSALVVAEVALACVLLVGAGLLFRSFSRLLQVDLGFQPQGAMAWRVDSGRSFANEAEAAGYYRDLVARVQAIPGVEAVGISDSLPLGRNRTWGAGAKGVVYPPGTYPIAFPRVVDEGYLQAMKIPLRAGRYFEARDSAANAELTIVLNETMAKRLWPDRDAVGEYVVNNRRDFRVIGVVADVRHGALEEAGGLEMYYNARQLNSWWGAEMVVRSSRPPESLVRDVRAALAAHDPGLPSAEYRALERLVDDAVASRRLMTRMLGSFSGLALALAAIGLYGVIAYSVVQRTQEIGIRMAIGAQRRDVLHLVLRSGLKLVAFGVVLGITGAYVLTRLLQSLLFGITAHDPVTFLTNAGLLLVVATVACLLPAWRATRLDPLAALRAE